MKNLRYILIFTSFIFCLPSFGVQIVYPKSDNVTISSPTTFFVGSEKSQNELYINNEKVNIHKSGGFFYPVKLDYGENTFTIDNKVDTKLVYRINRPKSAAVSKKLSYVEYQEPKLFLTSNERTVLRNAPDDSGATRLQELPPNISLVVVGEYGSYYKVRLSQDDFVWVDKSYLVKSDFSAEVAPSKLISKTYIEDDDKQIFIFKFDKKIPFILSENRYFKAIDEEYQNFSNGIDLVFYNVSGYPDEKYEIQTKSEHNLFGYKAYYKDSNEFVLEIKKIPKIDLDKPLKGIKITLDPGHGGSEYGAIGCLGDKEKDINLEISQKTKDILEKSGATVYLTRNGDESLGLYDRVKFSQDKNTDIFISIHSNALPDSSANSNRRGTSTYYFNNQSADFARVLNKTMTKELNTNDDKVHEQSFAVIRNPQSISVLVEVGYMIMPEDNSRLRNPEFQQKAAQSIKNALERYLNEI